MRRVACHSGEALLFAVYDGRRCRGGSGRWGTVFCAVAGAVPARLGTAPAPARGGADQTSGGEPDPKSPSTGRGAWRPCTPRCSPPAAPLRGGAADSQGRRRTAGPLRASAWPTRAALHRPAVAIHRLHLCPREWQGRVEKDRFGPVRGVDAPPRKGRSAAWGVGPPHGGPELGADDTGRLGRPPLPGLAAVGWSRRKRMALSGAGPRSAQGAVARAAALATVPRQGGTPRRTGGRSAPDRPRAPSRLTLRQRKAPSRDADCLRGQPRLRLVSQAPRQRRFSGIVGCGTPQEARPGAPL